MPDALRSGLVLVLAAVTATAAARLLDNLPARNIAGGRPDPRGDRRGRPDRRRRRRRAGRWCWRPPRSRSPARWSACCPPQVRRGPELASAVALTIIGIFVAVAAVRAALAPVQAARPIWRADTADYARHIAEAAGPSGWLLAFSALLLTIAAALALPPNCAARGRGGRRRADRAGRARLARPALVGGARGRWSSPRSRSAGPAWPPTPGGSPSRTSPRPAWSACSAPPPRSAPPG